MSTFSEGLSAWLPSISLQLDKACAATLSNGLAGLKAAELTLANAAVCKLYADVSSGVALPGGDCDYSLKGVATLYTAHWHGKRVHDAISVLVPLVDVLSNRPMTIVDLGAGTGAVLWAWSLIAYFSQLQGRPLPIHTWVGVDFSREMLEQKSHLWKALKSTIPGVGNVVEDSKSEIANWKSVSKLPLPRNAVVLGSYLFSRADARSSRQTATAFVDFLRRIHAAMLITWTKQNKGVVLSGLADLLVDWYNFTPSEQILFECSLNGRMNVCLKKMRQIWEAAGAIPITDWEKQFNWGRAPAKLCTLGLRR